MAPMGTATRTGHSHFWCIDPPSGPTSIGVCRDCGEKRTFRNRLTEEEEYQAMHAKAPKGFVYRIEYTDAVWR